MANKVAIYCRLSREDGENKESNSMKTTKENKNDKRKDRSADPIMRVLYSLLKDTDENHPLKKHELMENLDISRNACNNAVNELIDFIDKHDTPLGKLYYGTENNPDSLTNFYIEPLIKEHELRFIMDMIIQ